MVDNTLEDTLLLILDQLKQLSTRLDKMEKSVEEIRTQLNKRNWVERILGWMISRVSITQNDTPSTSIKPTTETATATATTLLPPTARKE